MPCQSQAWKKNCYANHKLRKKKKSNAVFGLIPQHMFLLTHQTLSIRLHSGVELSMCSFTCLTDTGTMLGAEEGETEARPRQPANKKHKQSPLSQLTREVRQVWLWEILNEEVNSVFIMEMLALSVIICTSLAPFSYPHFLSHLSFSSLFNRCG